MKITKLDKASRIAILDCMGAKSRESILVVSDVNKRKIGLSLFNNAVALGLYALYVEMKPGNINGEEPPEHIAGLMKQFDIVLCPTTKSLTHTDARRNASASGVRIATFPGITEDVMIRGLGADYKKIAARTMKLKKILEKGKEIRVITALGTDISFRIAGRKVIPSSGLFLKKGESGNLPTGETYLAPVEGTANGVFIVDGSMAGLGLIKNTNIRIEVKDGYAEKITGGVIAQKLVKMLDSVGRDARNIAEFGVGTNDTARLSGILLEDEKVMGTIHIALGNNKSMGGSVNVPIHLDGVVKKPTVYMDGKLLMKNGKLIGIE
ncbi:MAG: aminopeptidase [Ignavibacteriales bacterium]|jgi:leucyl aminopeptidase (aminopeptidase T)|nr:aminopeptidase [Ignavibacteriaceae bacterium]NLH60580.1 aminopeptidase [Ignavibacteriales bacterium]HOJ17441.1 aminopeptidase [Ignavibacteriaceae bacterium]HPO54729.1 aminopeptidase [Ignavibacteriaceae bacterium]